MIWLHRIRAFALAALLLLGATGGGNFLITVQNASRANIVGGSNGAVTNATLSTTTINFMIVYLAS